MVYKNFNLTEGSLYRTPLKLMEEIQGDEKRSWDLGYHHAKRGRRPDDSGAANKEDYTKGFEAGSGASSQQPPTEVQFRQASKEHSQDPMARRAYDLGYQHAALRKNPGAPSGYEDVYKSGFKAGMGKRQPTDVVGKSSRAISRIKWSMKNPSHGGEMPSGQGDLGSWIKDPNMSPRDMQASMANAAEEARSVLASKGVHISDKPIGCGQNGCVYQSSNPGQVIKVDKGDNEARFAAAILKNPELRGLKSIPKYVGVHSTRVKDKLTGADVYAIEREDLEDLPQEISYDPKSNQTMDWLSGELKILGTKIADGSISNRKDYNAHIDSVLHPRGELMKKVSAMHGGMFAQGVADITHMLRRGLVPCDIHLLNWGKRSGSNDAVMRDLGCFANASNLK